MTEISTFAHEAKGFFIVECFMSYSEPDHVGHVSNAIERTYRTAAPLSNPATLRLAVLIAEGTSSRMCREHGAARVRRASDSPRSRYI